MIVSDYTFPISGNNRQSSSDREPLLPPNGNSCVLLCRYCTSAVRIMIEVLRTRDPRTGDPRTRGLGTRRPKVLRLCCTRAVSRSKDTTIQPVSTNSTANLHAQTHGYALYIVMKHTEGTACNAISNYPLISLILRAVYCQSCKARLAHTMHMNFDPALKTSTQVTFSCMSVL